MARLLSEATRAVVADAVRRKRLFARLDPALEGGAVWVSGVPGAGKTMLVASWIAARHARAVWIDVGGDAAGVPSLAEALAGAVRAGRTAPRTRQASVLRGGPPPDDAMGLLRERIAALPARTVLILDDLPAVGFEASLRAILEELPLGVGTVIASRAEPPDVLTRYRVSGKLYVVEARALELTADESRAIARRHGFRGPVEELEKLVGAAQGWAAGLVLAVLHARERSPSWEEALAGFYGPEVLDRLEPRARRVVLEAALLPSLGGGILGRAIGDSEAEKTLADLARRGLFVRRREDDPSALELHPLFRAFVDSRSDRELPPGRAADVRRSAAAELASRGGEDAEAAVGLLHGAGAVDDLAALVIREAPGLLRAGRADAVERWLALLPSAKIVSDPWLALWSACARTVRDPAGARPGLERALAEFESRGEAAGIWLAWAALVEAILLAGRDLTPLGARLDELEALRARHPLPSPDLEARVLLAALTAAMQHAPGHPGVRGWAEAARSVALDRAAPPPARLGAGAQFLMYAGWWLGDEEWVRPVVAALAPLARGADADPFIAIFWLAVESSFHVTQRDEAASRRSGDEARALAASSGVRAWDAVLSTQAVWAALGADDVGAAGAALGALAAAGRPGSPLDLSVLRVMEGLVALRRGDLAAAEARAAEAKALSEPVGYALLHVFADVALARVRALRGDAAGSAAAYADASAKLGRMRSPCFEHVLALTEAERLMAAGDPRASEALARAMVHARAGAVHAQYFFSRAELARLCTAALERGADVDAARHLVHVRQLSPPGRTVEAWPWELRIRALGRVELERQGAAVAGTGRKPLELLLALVANGGREVPEAVAAEALWPGADGDAAQHALETTLYRLRRAVGREVVLQRDRKLSLVAERCWVDAFELEARLGAALAALDRRRSPGAAEDADRIAELYRGPFLGDLDAPWAEGARDRLRRRVVRWLDGLAAIPVHAERAKALRERLVAADPAIAASSAASNPA